MAPLPPRMSNQLSRSHLQCIGKAFSKRITTKTGWIGDYISLYIYIYTCFCSSIILISLVHRRVLAQVNFEKKFSSLPQFKPEEGQSPSAISVPSSPRFPNYHKKRSNTHRSSVDEESEVETPQSATSKIGDKGIVGNSFFGPDFNIDVAKGILT